MRYFFSFVIFAVLLMSFGGYAADVKYTKVSQPDVDVPNFVGYVPNAIVVKFSDDILSQIDKSALKMGKTGIFNIDQLSQRFDVQTIIQKFPRAKTKVYQGRVINLKAWHKIRFAHDVDIEEVVAAYKNLPGVVDAQPIGIHRIYRTPNDPKFPDQWHLDQANDADIDAPEAWDIQTGNEDIIVAILDTGVRYYHKDLGGANASSTNVEAARGNMWINWAEKNGVAGVDDDGNGYVDDWIGWDFVDGVNAYPGEDGDTPDNDPRDFNGHGTHCSGIVAAMNNNGYAVSSPSGGWGDGTNTEYGNGVKIMPLRIGWSERLWIFEMGYVSMDFAADAFYYAADNGARIASCSWGSSNTGGIADAIDYFLASGGLIFKAAGNDDNEESDFMTERTDIIAVASTDENDVKSDFSSYGTWVEISAPGSNIVSTYHDHNDPDNDYVATMSGTSMATPLAASVAALIWSQHPDWTADQVKQQLYDTADDIYSVPGNENYQGKLGAGRVNAYRAVNTGGGPAAPTANFTASPTSGCAPLTVTFTDQSTGDIDSWSWDFGDGSTSTEQNPTHQYTSAGTYTVKLTVTGPGGSDTETKVDYITVSDVPVADFSGSPTSGNAPLTVTFTDQSTGNPTSWSWDFGDGGTSTEQNPTHEYTVAGTYTVSLTVENSCGTDTETKVDYITVNEAPAQVMHVESVDVTKESFWIITRGNATVRIVDASGAPVADATVSGEWSGGANDTDQFTTDSDGYGSAVSDWVWGDAEFTFCVTDVSKSGWTYDPNANVETCGSTSGTAAVQLSANQVDFNEVEQQTGRKMFFSYPNPFNPTTTINFLLPEASHVKVEIFNILGEKVATLMNEKTSAGFKSVVWDARDNQGKVIGSGYYFYRITVNNKVLYVQKMLLMK